MGSDKAVEKHQVKQDVDLCRELFPRTLGQFALAEWHDMQKQPVHGKCVQVDEYDRANQYGGAAKISQRQCLQQPVSCGDAKHQNAGEKEKKKRDLRPRNFAQDSPQSMPESKSPRRRPENRLPGVDEFEFPARASSRPEVAILSLPACLAADN